MMMRVFVYSCILTMILFFAIANITLPILSKHSPGQELPIHKILYLEDNVSLSEFYDIQRATLEWSEVTNWQVSFDIERLPQKDIKLDNSIVVMHAPLDYPNVIVLDKTNDGTTVGFYDGHGVVPVIGIVYARIMNDVIYTAVVLHELGHSLDLEHDYTQNGLGTLMCPNISNGSYHITESDLLQFCKVHHCDIHDFYEN